MEITITSKLQSENSTYIDATCGKKAAIVGVNKDGSLQVCCKNAAHRAWRGFGRSFNNVADALTAYRSAEMKAIIEAAVSEA